MYCGVAPSCSNALCQLNGRLGSQFDTVEHPRAVLKGVLSLDLAAFYGKTQGSRTDAQEARGTRKVHPAFRMRLIAAVASNAVMATQRGHPFPRPTIATTGEQTISIEHTGNQIIGTDSCQGSDAANDLW